MLQLHFDLAITIDSQPLPDIRPLHMGCIYNGKLLPRKVRTHWQKQQRAYPCYLKCQVNQVLESPQLIRIAITQRPELVGCQHIVACKYDFLDACDRLCKVELIHQSACLNCKCLYLLYCRVKVRITRIRYFSWHFGLYFLSRHSREQVDVAVHYEEVMCVHKLETLEVDVVCLGSFCQEVGTKRCLTELIQELEWADDIAERL